jgi:hypothetical protein
MSNENCLHSPYVQELAYLHKSDRTALQTPLIRNVGSTWGESGRLGGGESLVGGLWCLG